MGSWVEDQPQRARRDPFEDMEVVPNVIDDRGPSHSDNRITVDGEEEDSHSEASPELEIAFERSPSTTARNSPLVTSHSDVSLSSNPVRERVQTANSRPVPRVAYHPVVQEVGYTPSTAPLAPQPVNAPQPPPNVLRPSSPMLEGTQTANPRPARQVTYHPVVQEVVYTPVTASMAPQTVYVPQPAPLEPSLITTPPLTSAPTNGSPYLRSLPSGSTPLRPRFEHIRPFLDQYPRGTPQEAWKLYEFALKTGGALYTALKDMEAINLDVFPLKTILDTIAYWEKTIRGIDGLSVHERIASYDALIRRLKPSEARSRLEEDYEPHHLLMQETPGTVLKWATANISRILWPHHEWILPRYEIGDDVQAFNSKFRDAAIGLGLVGNDALTTVYRTCFPSSLNTVGLTANTFHLGIEELYTHMINDIDLYVSKLKTRLDTQQPKPSLVMRNEPVLMAMDYDDQRDNGYHGQRQNGNRWGGQRDNGRRDNGHRDQNDQRNNGQNRQGRDNNGGRNGQPGNDRKRFADQPQFTRKAQCYKCGGKGHVRAECSSVYASNKRDDLRYLPNFVIPKPSCHDLCALSSPVASLLGTEVRIGDVLVWALIDTGAAVNCIRSQLTNGLKLDPANQKIRVANGDTVHCDFQAQVPFRTDAGQSLVMEALIVPDTFPVAMVLGLPMLLECCASVQLANRVVVGRVNGGGRSVLCKLAPAPRIPSGATGTYVGSVAHGEHWIGPLKERVALPGRHDGTGVPDATMVHKLSRARECSHLNGSSWETARSVTAGSNKFGAVAHLVDAQTKVIFEPLQKFGAATVSPAVIEVYGDAPRPTAARKFDDVQLKEIATQMDTLLKMDAVEPAIPAKNNVMWRSHCLLVKKSDGSARFCIDFRDLNRVTKKLYPRVHLIDTLLYEAADGVIFSSMDLSKSYWQIPIHVDSRPYTAFHYPVDNTYWQFKVMAFGLTNAPTYFQTLMDGLLAGIDGCRVYLDDIIVFTRTKERHDEVLREIFKRLASLNLRLNFDKCSFYRNDLDYLGHNIRHGQILITSKRAQDITMMCNPQNLKELNAVIGKMGFCSAFIQHFATLMDPVYKYRQSLKPDQPKKEELNVPEHVLQALREMAESIRKAAPLTVDQGGDLKIQSDASKYGLGATLLQLINGKWYPIRNISRRFNKSELNYDVTAKEAVAMLEAMKHFRHLMHAKTMLIETDHQPLISMIAGRGYDLGPRWANRISQLLEFKFELKYVPGCRNAIADALSRDSRFLDSPDKKKGELMYPSTGMVNVLELVDDKTEDVPFDVNLPMAPIRMVFDDLKHLQSTDFELMKMAGSSRRCFVLNDGVLMHSTRGKPHVNKDKSRKSLPRKMKIVAPQAVRLYLISCHHGDHHRGLNSTEQSLRRDWWWPTLREDVSMFIDSCSKCASKHLRRIRPTEMHLGEKQINLKWCMDYIGPIETVSGHSRHALVAIEAFSRFAIVRSYAHADADATVDFIMNHIKSFGSPKCILSDNGRHFDNEKVNALLSKQGIQFIHSTPYNPQSNGMVERLNRFLKERFALLDDPLTWPTHLADIVATYNTSIHSVTGFKPYELMFKRPVSEDPLSDTVLRQDIERNLDWNRVARENQARYWRMRARDKPAPTELKPGMSVKLINRDLIRAKGQSKLLDPIFKIEQVLGNNTVKLFGLNRPLNVRRVALVPDSNMKPPMLETQHLSSPNHVHHYLEELKQYNQALVSQVNDPQPSNDMQTDVPLQVDSSLQVGVDTDSDAPILNSLEDVIQFHMDSSVDDGDKSLFYGLCCQLKVLCSKKKGILKETLVLDTLGRSLVDRSRLLLSWHGISPQEKKQYQYQKLHVKLHRVLSWISSLPSSQFY